MSLNERLSEAVPHATWLEPTDDPALALLETVFEHLEYKADPTLVNRALGIMRELGFTPAARKRLGLWKDADDDAFAGVLRLVEAKAGGAEV